MLSLLLKCMIILLFIDVGVTTFLVTSISRKMLKDYPDNKEDYKMMIGDTSFVGFCVIPAVLLSIIFLILFGTGLIHA